MQLFISAAEFWKAYPVHEHASIFVGKFNSEKALNNINLTVNLLPLETENLKIKTALRAHNKMKLKQFVENISSLAISIGRITLLRFVVKN